MNYLSLARKWIQCLLVLIPLSIDVKCIMWKKKKILGSIEEVADDNPLPL